MRATSPAPQHGRQIAGTRNALDSRWKGQQADRFALRAAGKKAPHPFTNLSAWRGDGRVSFLVKKTDDHASTLSGNLKAGDRVRVDEPWATVLGFAARHRIARRCVEAAENKYTAPKWLRREASQGIPSSCPKPHRRKRRLKTRAQTGAPCASHLPSKQGQQKGKVQKFRVK